MSEDDEFIVNGKVIQVIKAVKESGWITHDKIKTS
jgi:hypothetical protein